MDNKGTSTRNGKLSKCINNTKNDIKWGILTYGYKCFS